MKSKLQDQTKTVKNLFLAFVLFLGMGLGNKALACTANFTYTTGLNGLVNFTSTSVGVNIATRYQWDANDGSGLANTGATNTYSHYYLANGTYHVLLYIYDSLLSCSDSIRLAITVSNVSAFPCQLSTSFTSVNGLDGQVTFTSTSQHTNANTLYFWNFGDGSPRIQGHDTITHKYIYSRWYGVWLVTQDTGNAYCIDSNAISIDVTNSDSNICSMTHPNFTYTLGPNGQVNFTSTSIVYGNPTFVWNPGDGSPEVNKGRDSIGFNHYYQSNGTFNAWLILNSDSACADSIMIPITVSNVSAYPCNMVAGFNMVHDSNGTEEFISTTTDTIPGNSQYYWNPGDGSGVVLGTSHYTHTYNFIGNYNPTLTVRNTGAYFCQDSITQSLNIWNRDSLKAHFVYAADSNFPGQYDFTSTSQGTNNNTYYRWTPGDGDPADSGIGMTTYTHTYFSNGPDSANLTIWYTIPPIIRGERVGGTIHYSESSFTLLIHVNTATGVTSVQNAAPKFELYPNPNNGQFKLTLNNLPKNQKAQISITNLLGETIYTLPFQVIGSNFAQDINIQGISAGMYFVKVVTANKVFTSRMVISK